MGSETRMRAFLREMRAELLASEINPVQEFQECETRLQDFAGAHGLIFATNFIKSALPVPVDRIRAMGAAMVHRVLEMSEEYTRPPYQFSAHWIALYDPESEDTIAWAEADPVFGRSLETFYNDPAFPWREGDAYSKTLLDDVIERMGPNAERGGYRKERVVVPRLRKGIIPGLVGRWITASLFKAGAQYVFTRGLVYRGGKSAPLRSLMRNGFVPIAYKRSVYPEGYSPPGNEGAVFALRFRSAKEQLDFVDRHLAAIVDVLKTRPVQHTLQSLRDEETGN